MSETIRPLTDQVILVTGATRGIGLATAHLLAKNGAHLGIACRSLHHSEALAKTLAEQYHTHAVPIELDVTKPPSVENMAEKLMKRFMRIDGIVNNAGVMHMDQLLEGDIHNFTEMMGTNVGGPFLVTRALISEMMLCRRGRIINVAAMAGLNGAPFLSGYCASKAALISLTQSWAEELAEYDIRVYALCPDVVATGMVSDLLDIGSIDTLTSEQVAERILQLLTNDDDASGEVIPMAATSDALS